MWKTKRPVKERRPVKVKVETPSEETIEEPKETIVEEAEKAVDTVVENEISNGEVEEAIKPQEETKETKKTKKWEGIKERTEEELVILPREEFYAVLEDIKAGKATVKQRQL